MALPEHNEPLRLADGRLVYPGGNIADPGAPARDGSDIAVGKPVVVRRKLADLPVSPRQMTAIGAVLSYVLFGLEEEDVASATGLSLAQVVAIRNSDPYRQLYEAAARTVLDGETDVVRELLAKNARRAANVMVDNLDAANRQDRMAAARDILDRSGHRPSDVVEHRHRMDGGLVIEIVKRDTSERMPTIDMED